VVWYDSPLTVSSCWQWQDVLFVTAASAALYNEPIGHLIMIFR